MKRSKSSVVFQYLPHNWVSYSDNTSLGAYSMEVKFWKYKELQGIYKKRLSQQIKKQLVIFRNSGGDTSEFGNLEDMNSFKFVEVDSQEGFEGIKGKISPLVFYCNKCGYTKSFNSSPTNYNSIKCPHCNKTMKQLQMIYSCTCGHAKPVFTTNRSDIIYRYKPRGGGGGGGGGFIVSSNGHERPQEMIYKCENCGNALYPLNATDGRNYKPHSITSVNLINKYEGELLERGLDAEKLQIGRWLNLVSPEEYDKILHNPKVYFENDFDDEEIDNKVRVLVELAHMSPEVARQTVIDDLSNGTGDTKWFTDLLSKIDSHVLINSSSSLSEELVEYYTLKNPNDKCTLDQALEKMKSIDTITNDEEIYELQNKLGIKDVQISFDIEIINATYGFTRLYSDPSKVTNGSKLKIKSYTTSREVDYLAYSNKLMTEGMLIEFDKKMILDWLLENKVINQSMLPPEDKYKEWFVKNINNDITQCFGDIDDSEENKITKYVYGLLHTISHMMIRSAGEISGLSKDSLSEMIFPNIPAIFIFANTSQAIPLGSLSGMFEMNYKGFLEKAFELSQNCIFDPLCSNEKGACSGCTNLSEISCCNFNNDLSRFYLIGSPETNTKTNIKGFWK